MNTFILAEAQTPTAVFAHTHWSVSRGGFTNSSTTILLITFEKLGKLEFYTQWKPYLSFAA